jgi:O-antigen ligase
MAAAVLLLAPLAALVPSRIPGRSGRVFLALFVALATAGLIVTFSRSAYLGALAGVAALIILTWYRTGRWRRAHTWGLFALGCLLVAAFALVGAGRYGQRNAVWSRATRIADHHLLTGVGLGGSRAALGSIQGDVVYHAHNLWLNWLLVAGVLGLVAVIAVTFVSLRRPIVFAMTGSRLAQAAMVALVAFYVSSLFDDPAYLHDIGLIWWFVIGFAMSVDPAAASDGRSASSLLRERSWWTRSRTETSSAERSR